MKLLKSPYLTACIAILTSLSAFFCWMILDYHYMVDYFVQENGPVENVTLVAYVVAIARHSVLRAQCPFCPDQDLRYPSCLPICS